MPIIFVFHNELSIWPQWWKKIRVAIYFCFNSQIILSKNYFLVMPMIFVFHNKLCIWLPMATFLQPSQEQQQQQQQQQQLR